jgi:hypothetical protein
MPRFAAPPPIDPFAELIELFSALFAAAIDRFFNSSKERQQPAESRRSDAERLEKGGKEIADPAAAPPAASRPRRASMPNRQRIGRQNGPRAATALTRRAIRRRVAFPAGEIHGFEPRIALMTRIEHRPPAAAKKILSVKSVVR